MNNVMGKETPTVHSLRQLESTITAAGDGENAAKVRQLIDKAEEEKLYVAFCGHFSAGKSSLINKLCGHPLLPSSPIPTSANIVKITGGDAGALVYGHKAADGERTKPAAVKLEELDSYCKNGADIETVEIRYPIPLLDDKAVLLDTPGIDSTDDAHHMATESALHLADVVFYVMDYNHVQSEINFAFTKQLKEWGKPLYLIINMIDKHREEELPFAEYRESAVQAFRNWHIEPDGVFYTSVRDETHPLNEWRLLLDCLGNLFGIGSGLTAYSLACSAEHVVKEHAKWAAGRNNGVKASLQEELAGIEGLEELKAEHVSLTAKLSELTSLPERLGIEMRKAVTGVLDNANIIPAGTRELAHHYLQSRKPGFKAGFLASAAKTAQEVERRLNAFLHDFAEKVHTQVEWHVRDTLKKEWLEAGLKPDAAAGTIDAVHEDITGAWLASQVNGSAVFSAEYTMTYSKLVASEAKLAYRQQAFSAIERLGALAAEQSGSARAELEARAALLDAQLGAQRELERLAGEEAAYEARLLAQLPAVPAAPALPVPQARAAQAAAAAVPAAAQQQAPPAARAQRERAAAAAGALTASRRRDKLAQTAAKLEAAASAVDGAAGLASAVRAMREKAARLAGSRFTIALFGAFSAGKSSFANALVGERILPVSPNPTTAAINKIMPPEPDWPHGTARVRMKPLAAVEDDIRYSLRVLGVETNSLEQALAAIAGLSPAAVAGNGKPHYTFLQAVRRGWENASPNLGKELRVGLEQFREYVAEESKSCFVQEIELFDSNPLTEQGIVFVDTPGADSINARHTGVAFNYIKNADAILFVTYYNHAFSQADREFLLQLGRVKDSFELDKMFFIVNAADLASSKDELQGVVDHVGANLLTHGIRHPRIYPVSSLQALQGKLNGDQQEAEASGIAAFEREFVKFAVEELTEIAIRSAYAEIRRTSGTLSGWIAGSQADEADRRKQSAALKVACSTAIRSLEQSEPQLDEQELGKEIQELLYYVRQRTTFRFNELYNNAFNPAILREDAGDSKVLLQSSWNDLVRMIGFDLEQESLATTLRIENKMNALAKRRYSEWEESVREHISSYAADDYTARSFATPALEAKFEADLAVKVMQAHYRNAKSFFEGDGKQKLRQVLEVRLAEPIASYAAVQADRFEQAYGRQYRELFAALKEHHNHELQQHVGGLTDALDMKLDTTQLQRQKAELESLLKDE